MAKNSSDNANQAAGIAFVSCIIVGVGLGMLFDNAPAGSVLGVGIGFLVMAAVRLLHKD